MDNEEERKNRELREREAKQRFEFLANNTNKLLEMVGKLQHTVDDISRRLEKIEWQ